MYSNKSTLSTSTTTTKSKQKTKTTTTTMTSSNNQLPITKTTPQPLPTLSAIPAHQSDSSSDCQDNEPPCTPTSPGRRLDPEVGPCPPAPRKPKSLPMKRRWSPDHQREYSSRSISTNRLLDFSKEIESMYPPLLQANLGRKIKKTRTV